MKISTFVCAIAILLYVEIASCQQNKISIRRYRGTAGEMAASFAKDEGRRFTEMYHMIMAEEGINTVTRYLAFQQARKFERYLDSETMEEIKTFAKKAHVDYEQVLLSNCFYDMKRSGGCRQVVAWGEKTRNGSLLHARNLDWPDWGNALRSNNVLLVRTYPAGNAIATFTWPGLFGCLTGCNDKELTVAFNQLYGVGDRSGTPVFIILKKVLRHADSLQKALKIINSSDFCTDGSIMVSSAAERSAILVEVKSGEVFIQKAPGLFMVNNNTDYFDSQGQFEWPHYRESPFYQLVEKNAGLNTENIQEIMGHPDVMLDCNLLSAVFSLESNEIYVSCGCYHAARGPFRKISPLFETQND